MAKRTAVSLKDIIPYLGSYLIFLGVLRLIIYYRSFNVNIVSFLDFTEILTSFFDILVIVVVIAIVVWLPFRLGGQSEVEKNQINSIWNEPSLQQRLRKYVRYLSSDIILGVFITISLVMLSFLGSLSKELVVVMSLYYFALLVLRVVMIEIAIKHRDSDEGEKMFNSAFKGMVVSIAYIFLVTYGELRAVKDDNKYIGTRIDLTDNSTIHSNENYYFIGKTNNYVFIHSELRNETEVLPMSRIKSITFPDPPPTSD